MLPAGETLNPEGLICTPNLPHTDVCGVIVFVKIEGYAAHFPDQAAAPSR
jgi:hypothetical protein